MDDDGYPEDDELAKVRAWPYTDCLGLLEYVQSLWHWGVDYFHPQAHCEGRWEASTGGWSGNESLIGAMQENKMFWVLCWMSSRRGGHFEFQLPAKEVLKLRASEPAACDEDGCKCEGWVEPEPSPRLGK